MKLIYLFSLSLLSQFSVNNIFGFRVHTFQFPSAYPIVTYLKCKVGSGYCSSSNRAQFIFKH